MQGTILVIDGVSTNRIALKVQLSEAYFDVVQIDSLAALEPAVAQKRPDLVITALSLPDGTAVDVKRSLNQTEAHKTIPVVAIDAQDNITARLAALAAGVQDVLLQPVDDMVLQARIRSLLRARSAKEELRLQRDAAGRFALSAGECLPAGMLENATVALVTQNTSRARCWSAALAMHSPFKLRCHNMTDIRSIMTSPVPDAIVIELNEETAGLGLRLIADLRARAATRQSIIVALPESHAPELAAEALDRGAHDVLQAGFIAEELNMRLTAQLEQKLQDDHLRDSIRSELKAAVLDPMTGLYNRRYATPYLEQVLQHARDTGESFALMVADLDHFKRVNDAFGHPVGDAVLVETAARLKPLMGPKDLLARIGGEEFLFVLPGQSAAEAAAAAANFCAAINERSFHISGVEQPIKMTVSIGAVIATQRRAQEMDAAELISEADQALYAAKNAGRNRVNLKSNSPVAA